MKVAINKDDGNNKGSAISGKDKAKLLKLMREQQRDKEINITAESKIKQNRTGSSVTNVVPNVDKNFLIDEVPLLKISKSTASNVAKEITSTKTNAKSTLPVGFFDDPVDDLNARGISIEQFRAAHSLEEQNQLDSFMNEIKNMPEEEDSHETETTDIEYLDEMQQVSYLASVVALRMRSDLLKRKHNSDIDQSKEKLEQILKESAVDITNYDSNEISTTKHRSQERSNAHSEVIGSILHRKMMHERENKRRRAEIVNTTKQMDFHRYNNTDGEVSKSDNDVDSDIDNSDSDNSSENSAPLDSTKYCPLQFIDWTSKSL